LDHRGLLCCSQRCDEEIQGFSHKSAFTPTKFHLLVLPRQAKDEGAIESETKPWGAETASGFQQAWSSALDIIIGAKRAILHRVLVNPDPFAKTGSGQG
jgi:hypothetical protein